jgi:DNA-binding IclR family transcriptional regulator
MSKEREEPTGGSHQGPRAILRVPEVLIAIAEHGNGATLAGLSRQLEVPKTSLHRLLRTLEQAGYLVSISGAFFPGPESARLATALQGVTPQLAFPACARPVLEWLAGVTGETAMLGMLAEHGRDIIYVDVIESKAPLRYAPSIGDRRPLYAVPAGKAILAFQSPAYRINYIESTDFRPVTPETTPKADLPPILERVRLEAVAFDRNGYIAGGSALASPIFGRDGIVRNTVSVTGPTERIVAKLDRLRDLTRTAGERISRTIGYSGPFPPD